MLNYQKIRIMTKLAQFEESKDGKEALKTSKYYRRDFVRFELLKTIVSVTVGYILIMVLVLVYQSEYIIENAVQLDYMGIGSKVLGGYLILIVAYTFTAFLGYSIKYNIERKRLGKYYGNLKRLRNIYKEDNEAKQEVRIK